jgi:hypothetical protein
MEFNFGWLVEKKRIFFLSFFSLEQREILEEELILGKR